MRRRGFGRHLVKMLAERVFAGPGTSTVTLMVYRDNPGALALHRTPGFVAVEAESRQDAIFMKIEAGHLAAG